MEHFTPHFEKDCYINFTGGEPLLAFDRLKCSIDFLQKKKKELNSDWAYTLTTNGNLIDSEIINYLTTYNFHVTVSFDGQSQDLNRKADSYDKTVAVIKRLVKTQAITVETNSVLTPASVEWLAESIQEIIEFGVPDILLSISSNNPWRQAELNQLKEQLVRLSDFLIIYYRSHRTIPLLNFRKPSTEGVLKCEGGRSRLALAPDGTIWGCYIPQAYAKQDLVNFIAKDYCFGPLADIQENTEPVFNTVIPYYARLRLDMCYTDQQLCLKCNDLEDCSICPITASQASQSLGKIPDWMCASGKILREARQAFLERIDAE